MIGAIATQRPCLPPGVIGRLRLDAPSLWPGEDRDLTPAGASFRSVRHRVRRVALSDSERDVEPVEGGLGLEASASMPPPALLKLLSPELGVLLSKLRSIAAMVPSRQFAAWVAAFSEPPCAVDTDLITAAPLVRVAGVAWDYVSAPLQVMSLTRAAEYVAAGHGRYEPNFEQQLARLALARAVALCLDQINHELRNGLSDGTIIASGVLEPVPNPPPKPLRQSFEAEWWREQVMTLAPDYASAFIGDTRYGKLRFEAAAVVKVEPKAAESPAADSSGGQIAAQAGVFARTGAPGRPSLMDQVKLEMRRRAKSGLLLTSLARESQVLSDWVQQAHHQHLTKKSIENGCRELYRSLRQSEIPSQ